MMAKYNKTHSDINTLAYDVRHYNAKDLEDMYGIQFVEDPKGKSGKVFDSVTSQEFPSVKEWIAYQWDESAVAGTEKYGNNKWEDEDY